jgi:5-methylcytosine-specific restriction endonuclease McrA
MIAKPKSRLKDWRAKCEDGTGICAKCGRKDNLTVDHIIPLSFLLELGLEKDYLQQDEKNFQILCLWCNRMKGCRLDHMNPKTIPLLKEYIHWYEAQHSTNN